MISIEKENQNLKNGKHRYVIDSTKVFFHFRGSTKKGINGCKIK